ncbi:MAG: VPLPA-CTERM sorting domain-containing protein [Nitrospira sp.]
MQQKTWSVFFLMTGLITGCLAGLAQAAVLTTGDVVPSNPATWAANTPVSIAKTANGSATVNGGSTVTTGLVDVASTFGVTGTLSVDGPGSTWNVGNLGLVTVATSSLPDNFAGGTGTVNITNGGTVNATVFVGSAFNTTGSLNIASGGRVTKGVTLGDSNKSTGIMTIDGSGSSVGGGRTVSVGEKGNGFLKVLNGATINSGTSSGIVARYDTSASRGIVDGVGSSWTMGQLTIGQGMANNGSGGVGLLTVSNGATLSNTRPAELGFRTGGTGIVMVNGAGTTWTSIAAPGSCSQFDPVCGLNIGVQGTGRVSVSDGATLTTNALGINNKSTLTVDLGTGSTVSVSGSTGTLTNDGTIRLAAKATAANGTYAPITAGTWNGAGTVQALGGVYNPTTHSVTVSSAATGQAGVATTIDPSVTQRMLITDSATGQQVGASFQATQTPSNISLIASLMGPSQLSLLQGLLDPGKAVLGAWNFSATGYTQGDPVYLSLQVGGGQKFYDLDVWHFDGTGWARYLNSDLAYDNKFASFVANGFSGYAISGLAAVPVPAAVWLFGSGLAALVGLARRRTV